MNDALNIMYYILNKYLNFIFGSYIFEGVSIGMILIVSFIFTILIKYLLAIPRINLGGKKIEKDK